MPRCARASEASIRTIVAKRRTRNRRSLIGWRSAPPSLTGSGRRLAVAIVEARDEHDVRRGPARLRLPLGNGAAHAAVAGDAVAGADAATAGGAGRGQGVVDRSVRL